LKIAFPHLKLTIVESLNKRITFLNEVCRELTLDDVSFFHGRAEDLGRDARLRDTFDLVTARAVARLHTLSELCLPFVKVNGTFVAMKGTQAEEEIIEAKGAWRELNGKCVASHQLALPEEDSSRSIIVIQKTAATPKKYPRKAGIPNKQPLL
jgi:16S rRNA (guanine527-N7)-methyltransferase